MAVAGLGGLRMKPLIRPPGTSRIRKDSSAWLGAELKE
jgi:hypothetical protein